MIMCCCCKYKKREIFFILFFIEIDKISFFLFNIGLLYNFNNINIFINLIRNINSI